MECFEFEKLGLLENMVRLQSISLARKKLIVSNILSLAAALQTIKKKKVWSKQWILRRFQQGCYENLFKELALEVSKYYYNKLY